MRKKGSDTRTREAPFRVHHTTLKQGIRSTPKFAEKGLASFAANVGTKCGHDCTYCSTGAMLRMHTSFAVAGEDPFGHGYAIVDPTTPERVGRSAARRRKDKRGLVQLCTTVDAWSPEAQMLDLGRRSLAAILAEPGWEVRILTKNAAVAKDFDLVAAHRNRVRVGLSLTAMPAKQKIMSIVEPNASTMSGRIAAMKKAHGLGLRTYAMLCPLLPGIADDEESVRELVRLGIEFGAEEFFVEPFNARGSDRQTADALGRPGSCCRPPSVRYAEEGVVPVRRLLAVVQAELGAVGASEAAPALPEAADCRGLGMDREARPGRPMARVDPPS